MSQSGTDDLVITIGGDLSQFQAALEQIQASAQATFATIQGSLQAVDFAPLSEGARQAGNSLGVVDAAAASMTGDLSNLAGAASGIETNLVSVGEAAAGADGRIASLGEEVTTAGQAAAGASGSVTELSTAVEQSGESAGQAEQGFHSLYGQMIEFGEALAITEGLKEFGKEALTTYGDLQKTTISLQALTGSATQANEIIEGLEKTASSDALSFPAVSAAAQKMIALGFSTEQMGKVLTAAANTAAATGNEFTSVAESIDRLALSGLAGARQLATLGLSTQALNVAMGTAGAGANASAGQISKAFAALSQSSRLDALTTALSKFGGVATQVAQGVSGQWQDLKTQFEFVMEAIGQALAPVITAMLRFASTAIIPAIQAMVSWFNQLPAPIKDAAVAVGLLIAAIGPVAVAVGGFALAMTGLKVAMGEVLTEEGLLATTTATLGGAFSGALTAIESVATAVSTGLVGALTMGETVLLGFAAVVVAVGAAFVVWDQIKQLIANLENLGDVLSAGVPLWNDIKAAALGARDAFVGLIGSLSPVESAIRSIGGYLPSFSGLWNGVRDAIGSIHWSDLIGPIGALNGALKALADAIELVTGRYPSMATAGATALSSLEGANDKLNASLAQQAMAHQTATAAVVAHAAAASATTDKVEALGAAHASAAVAANAHAAATTEATSAVKLFVGPVYDAAAGVRVLGGAHLSAASAAAEHGSKLNAAQAAALGLGVELIQGTVPAINALSGATSSATTIIDGATGATEQWSNSLQKMVTSAGDAVAAIDNVGSAATQASSDIQELDQNMGSTGKGKGTTQGLSFQLQPGQTYSEPAPGTYISTGGLTQDPVNPLDFYGTKGETPFGDITQIYESTAVLTHQTKAASAATQTLATAATAAATATSNLATTTDAVNTATATVTVPALNALNDGLLQGMSSTAGLSSAALNGESAVSSLTVAATTASTALSAASTAVSTVGGVLVEAADATQNFIQAANQAIQFVSQPTGIGYGSGVGGLVPTIGGVATPVIGGGPASGVTGGMTGVDQPSVTFNIPINAGTVVGANGMQQLSQMVGAQLVSILAARGIRLNRQ